MSQGFNLIYKDGTNKLIEAPEGTDIVLSLRDSRSKAKFSKNYYDSFDGSIKYIYDTISVSNLEYVEYIINDQTFNKVHTLNPSKEYDVTNNTSSGIIMNESVDIVFEQDTTEVVEDE